MMRFFTQIHDLGVVQMQTRPLPLSFSMSS